MKTKNSIFISYAREDLSTALRIHRDLTRLGIDAWIDAKNLTPGQNWKRSISRAIKSSSFFIALLSSNSVSKRGYVQKELKIAFEVLDEFPIGDDVFIIPVRLNDCTVLDEELESLHWVDLFDSYAIGFNQIYQAINQIPEQTHTKEKEFLLIDKGGNKSYFSSYSTDVIQEKELANVSKDYLSQYAVVYREWSRLDASYHDYFSSISKIFEFIHSGGVAVIHISGNCGDQDNVSSPGIQYRISYNDREFFSDPNHPYLTGKGYAGESLRSEDFSEWRYTDHGYLVNVPSFATVILENIDGPSLIEFNYGRGVVILSTITFGCCTPKSFDPGAPLTNLLTYSQYLANSIGGLI